MIAIISKELRTYFTQMSGYVFLALTVFIIALFYVFINIFQLSPNFHFVLNNVTILFFIIIPTLTMRLFADEVRNKTDQLLYTSPLPIWHIVVGKYIAAAALFMLAMAITVLFPVILSGFGTLPISQIVGAYLGYILIGLGFISIGLFISVMTENQIIAAVATAGAIFITFLLESLAAGMPADATSSLIFLIVCSLILGGVLYNSTKNIYGGIILAVLGTAISVALYFTNPLMYDGLIPGAFRWFSVFTRFDNMTNGVLHLADVVFYITMPIFFIYLTVNIIEKRRWK
ncbi:MAG: ABC-2 transporter permease [Firmicutes bacterium]|nr:ABC-2 transporter permease [Bacillota bacterium]